MNYENPFALARASDYTNEQINSLWVEMGPQVVDAIIEPRTRISKYILGGKGTGKTHLLRYFSYPAARMRHNGQPGLGVVLQQGFLAIFLRATGLDASRFELATAPTDVWQQLFGIYLELRLAELVAEALCDIKLSSPDQSFNDAAFIETISQHIADDTAGRCTSVETFRDWIVQKRREFDNATNNAAFSGRLDVHLPFSLGSLSLSIGPALGVWHQNLNNIPLLYLIDEIENFSGPQQQVVNSLIRYGEGHATFRVTGRLYAIRTLSTLGDGEENREGAEFKKTILDEIISEFKGYSDFARRFVVKRLLANNVLPATGRKLNPSSFFAEIESESFYAEYLEHESIDPGTTYLKRFSSALRLLETGSVTSEDDRQHIVDCLTGSLPLMIGKLNLLLFSKKLRKQDPVKLANQLRSDSLEFISQRKSRSYYATAYNHYAGDLFAQLCRDSKGMTGIPYAGFDNFVKMSSGNPRSLLIILGRIFEIAAFRGLKFAEDPPLPVAIQTEGVEEAARFMYESDANYGSQSDQARIAVSRFAAVLRTARYALNIPEVAPLCVSFANEDLTSVASDTLRSALNYSLIFEISAGRPDRNSHKVLRKIHLNPMLSPRWGLPVGRRGDISLSGELLNAIFETERKEDFEILLRSLENRWNQPFGSTHRLDPTISSGQTSLF